MGSYFQLSNGVRLPQIGLGTYKTRGYETVLRSLSAALASGYRCIDTASVYRNESDIGAALREVLPKENLTREDIFITTKLAPKDQGVEGSRKAIAESLKNLGTDFVDLFLIHWPGVRSLKPDDPRNKILRNESWGVIEELYKSGVFRSIGVSNYEVSHLEDLLSHCTVRPHVNQVECHPHYQQKELAVFCRANDIHLQAYSSLGTTVTDSPLLSDPEVVKVADKHRKSPAQVLLRWGIDHGYSVLPKSTDEGHIRENIQIIDFKLDEEDIKKLDGNDKIVKYAWNPKVVD